MKIAAYFIFMILTFSLHSLSAQGNRQGQGKMSYASKTWLYSDYGQDFVVTDPKGRRVGKNGKTGGQFREIPNATYDMEPAIGDADLSDGAENSGPSQMYFQFLGHLTAGTYKVDLYGKPNAKFHLRVVEADSGGAPFRGTQKKGHLPESGLFSFTFELSSEPPAKKM